MTSHAERCGWGTRFTFLLVAAVALPSCLDGSGSYEVVARQLLSEGARYDIRIAVPADYSAENAHATIYVLDPEWYFERVAAEADYHRREGHQGAVVVGIGWGRDRAVDYTPTVADLSGSSVFGSAQQGGGGADRFTRFVAEDLIPSIENEFRVDTHRTGRVLLGHSLGGLYGAYMLINHNAIFGTYLLLSPAVWYDEGLVLHQEEDNRQRIRERRQVVYMSSGELEPAQLFTKMFADRLRSHYPQSVVRYDIIRRKNHSSSAEPAIRNGLTYFFGNRLSP